MIISLQVSQLVCGNNEGRRVMVINIKPQNNEGRRVMVINIKPQNVIENNYID